MSKPVVCVVGTSGTIASRFDPTVGGHVSAASARDLVEAVPELAEIAEIRVVQHSNINSALMDTPTAFALRDTLRRVLADDAVAGAVVTHGTATFEESAYLMDITLGSEKPVVFTGAQRNADEKDPDGPRNLLYAAMIAADPAARGRGVLASLKSDAHAALLFPHVRQRPDSTGVAGNAARRIAAHMRCAGWRLTHYTAAAPLGS